MKPSKNKRTSNYKKSNTNSSSDSMIGKIYLLPIIFLIAVLPFLMHLYEFNTGLSKFAWGPASDEGVDIFLYYKSIFFIITTVILALGIIYYLVIKKSKHMITFPLVILFTYAVLSILSTIFSKYTHWGLTGFLEQFESVFILVGYCIIVYYIWLFVKTEQDVRLIFKYFIISILILSLLGLLQFMGQDFLATTLGKKLYIPSKYWNSLDSIEFRFEANRIFLTLFNPNYVGVYVAMVIPILAGLLFTERTKKNVILLSLSIVGMLVCLVGSLSTTGFITIIISFLFLILFFRKYIFRSFKINMIILGAILLVCVPIVAIKSGTIINTFNKLLDIKPTEFAISEIKTEETLSITYQGNILNVNMDLIDNNIEITLTDDSGLNISSQVDAETNNYIITDNRFKDITYTPIVYNNMLCIQATINDKAWIFSNQTGDNTFYYLNVYGKFDKIITPDSVLFTGYENYASSRGYIWSRSIPLLKDYIFLGAGADAYTFAFPQQDYVGLYNSGFEGQLLTKPHNMYLQIGIQTGILSLLCILAFYGMYFIKSIRLYMNGKFDSYFKRVGVSIFLGTIGYMIAGLSNDSSITVSPVFWVLLGMGYTINHLVASQSTDK